MWLIPFAKTAPSVVASERQRCAQTTNSREGFSKRSRCSISVVEMNLAQLDARGMRLMVFKFPLNIRSVISKATRNGALSKIGLITTIFRHKLFANSCFWRQRKVQKRVIKTVFGGPVRSDARSALRVSYAAFVFARNLAYSCLAFFFPAAGPSFTGPDIGGVSKNLPSSTRRGSPVFFSSFSNRASSSDRVLA